MQEADAGLRPEDSSHSSSDANPVLKSQTLKSQESFLALAQSGQEGQSWSGQSGRPVPGSSASQSLRLVCPTTPSAAWHVLESTGITD